MDNFVDILASGGAADGIPWPKSSLSKGELLKNPYESMVSIVSMGFCRGRGVGGHTTVREVHKSLHRSRQPAAANRICVMHGAGSLTFGFSLQVLVITRDFAIVPIFCG